MNRQTMIEMRENMQESALDEADKADPQSTVSPIPEIPDATINTPDQGYSRLSMISMVVFSGLAIGSDGFNASIIGNLELIMGVIYTESLTTAVAARLSNAFMVGMIVGMLSFGYISDRLGRKTGAILTTILLVLGIALSAGASGITENGMFWMLIIARGVAGVGAGGFVPHSS
jgi:MFS family permease